MDDQEGEDANGGKETMAQVVDRMLEIEGEMDHEGRKTLTGIANYLGCSQAYVSKRKSRLEAEERIEW